jgi:hypothetical protein
MGARHDTKHAGGESQPEERRGLVVEVLKIEPGTEGFGYNFRARHL